MLDNRGPVRRKRCAVCLQEGKILYIVSTTGHDPHRVLRRPGRADASVVPEQLNACRKFKRPIQRVDDAARQLDCIALAKKAVDRVQLGAVLREPRPADALGQCNDWPGEYWTGGRRDKGRRPSEEQPPRWVEDHARLCGWGADHISKAEPSPCP